MVDTVADGQVLAATVEITDEKQAVWQKWLSPLFNGVTILVGSIIGCDIFISLTGIQEKAESVGLSLLVWMMSAFFVGVGTEFAKEFANQMFGSLSYMACRAIDCVKNVISTSSRLFYAGERDGRVPLVLALITQYIHTLIPAIFPTDMLSVVCLAASGDVFSLLNYTQIVHWFTVACAIAALFWLPRTIIDAEGPIKLCPSFHFCVTARDDKATDCHDLTSSAGASPISLQDDSPSSSDPESSDSDGLMNDAFVVVEGDSADEDEIGILVSCIHAANGDWERLKKARRYLRRVVRMLPVVSRDLDELKQQKSEQDVELVNLEMRFAKHLRDCTELYIHIQNSKRLADSLQERLRNSEAVVMLWNESLKRVEQIAREFMKQNTNSKVNC